LEGKALALSKGLLHKFKLRIYLALLVIWIFLHMTVNVASKFHSAYGAVFVCIILLLNATVPFVQVLFLKEKTMHLSIGLATETDKKVANKGVDLSFSEVLSRAEFWLFGIAFGIVYGVSQMIRCNVEELALGDTKDIKRVNDFYQAFEMLGVILTSIKLHWLRKWFSPVIFLTCAISYSIFP